MLDAILPFMRCPSCLGTRLEESASELSCRECGRLYSIRDGILDVLVDGCGEMITPFQRIMQTGLVVAVYERLWRPLGFYLASSRSFSQEIRNVVGLLSQADCSRVLDLACGPGVFTRPLARMNRGIVVGFDLSRPMLRRARFLLLQEGIENVILIRGTAFRLPFIAGAFTAINCCGALHLFDQPDPALREVDRVLRPGGHLAIQTTIRPIRSGGFAFVLERFIRFGFFEEGELREKLRLHRFQILEAERHRISYTLLARHIAG